MKKSIGPVIFVVFVVLAIAFYIFIGMKQEPVFEQESVDDGKAQVSLVVKAPETCEIGEMVTIDATGSNADAFEWLVIPATPDFRVITNGQEALFSARAPGSYTFIIAATRDGVLQPLTTIAITVLPLKIVPVVDDFTIKVKGWLPPNADPEILEKLARSFERVASANHTDVASLVKTTALSNRAILGTALPEYKDFLVAFSLHLKDNMTDATINDHVELWFSLASALRAIK
jgi:hypothetical protein